MAGPLGVSHLLLFSRSESGNLNLRLALTPRGPTLHFRIESYSLCKDIQKTLRHAKSAGKEYVSPPLLVMNNFKSSEAADGDDQAVPKHLESLITSIFQSLFPAISPQNTPLSSIRRVLLLNREATMSSERSSINSAPYTLNLRHYAISTKRTGLSRGVRKLDSAEKLLNSRKTQQRLPNLGRLNDVADYLLDPAAAGGYTSGSESEVETDAEVEVLGNNTKKVLSRKELAAMRAKAEDNVKRTSTGVEKRAVKLVELGPRLKLRLVKVEEGVCGGKVMWHEYLRKSTEEANHLDAVWEQRRKEKEERKRVQKENVERKRKENGTSSKADDREEIGDEMDVDDADWISEDESSKDQMHQEEIER